MSPIYNGFLSFAGFCRFCSSRLWRSVYGVQLTLQKNVVLPQLRRLLGEPGNTSPHIIMCLQCRFFMSSHIFPHITKPSPTCYCNKIIRSKNLVVSFAISSREVFSISSIRLLKPLSLEGELRENKGLEFSPAFVKLGSLQ